jgi:type I restriction enzyme S subunit
MGSVILMKPHAGLNSAYLLQALKAGFFQTRLTAVSGSTAQQAIYIRDIRPLQMPLPPQAEQARIVAEVDRHLSIIREVEAEVDTNLQRAQALRQSTLAKAFST